VPALASGAIDATMTSATTGVAQKYWEFLDTAYATNHNWASNMMVVSKAAWEALSEQDQVALEALARRLEPEFWEIAKADDARTRAILIDQGMTVLPPSEEMADQMRAVARPMWEEFAVNVPGADTILAEYLSASGRQPLERAP
ncbi:MAG: TRAP transporter substrate-binding protein DctP, partial [Pseudomonadota bacterium]